MKRSILDNHTVALFMGAKKNGAQTLDDFQKFVEEYTVQPFESYFKEVTYYPTENVWINKVTKLLYNRSWDWLLPVWDEYRKKCNELRKNHIIAEYSFYEQKFMLGVKNNDIDFSFSVIVEAIEDYNKLVETHLKAVKVSTEEI